MATLTLPASDIHPLSNLSGGTFKAGTYTRVFYQKKDLSITAVQEDGGKGFVDNTQRSLIPPGVAKAGTPLCTVNFTWKGDLRSRTYFLGNKNELRYGAMDKGVPSHSVINDGEFIAADFSSVGAFGWVVDEIPHLRVYFQKPDQTIQELCWDGSDDSRYTKGSSLPTSLRGTSLAFVNQSIKGDQYFRGFYQSIVGTIKQRLNEPKYDYIGTNIFELPIAKGSRISANTAPTGLGKGHVGVYWQNAEGGVDRCALDNKTGLWGRATEVDKVQTKPGSGILALAWNPEEDPKAVKERIVFIDNEKMKSVVF